MKHDYDDDDEEDPYGNRDGYTSPAGKLHMG